MKKTLFVLLAAVAVGNPSFSQVKGKAPQAVVRAFQQKFPKATDVAWDKENAHEYEAAFKLQNQTYSANFNEQGEWLETESTILFGQLPESVQKAFLANHGQSAAKEVAKIETSKGSTQYEVEVKQGNKSVDLVYDSSGKPIKE